MYQCKPANWVNDITDIAVGLDVNLKLFADDAKLYSSFSYNFSSSSDLIDACYNLTLWAETRQLQRASEKCFVHRVTNRDCHKDHTADCIRQQLVKLVQEHTGSRNYFRLEINL